MAHIPFNPKLYALPTTQLILGTHHNGSPNFMALAWATRVNFQPPLIAIAVNKVHASHKGIEENQEFSLCMPDTSLVTKTDYVGLVSGNKTNKSEMFEIFYGEMQAAPLIKECPLNLEMKLFETVSLPTNSVFIGEIKGTWCDEKCLTDGVPDVTKINPFLLTMPDNQYWGFGSKVGDAWKAGKDLK